MVTNEAGDKGVSASSLALCADGSQSPGIRLGRITVELIRIYAGPVAYRDVYGCGERQHIHNDHRIALGDQFAQACNSPLAPNVILALIESHRGPQ